MFQQILQPKINSHYLQTLEISKNFRSYDQTPKLLTFFFRNSKCYQSMQSDNVSPTDFCLDTHFLPIKDSFSYMLNPMSCLDLLIMFETKCQVMHKKCELNDYLIKETPILATFTGFCDLVSNQTSFLSQFYDANVN